MKYLLICVLLLGSFSAFSQDFSKGGVLKLSIDWERTFDFITGQARRDKKMAKVEHCKLMYKNFKESSDLTNQLIKEGEIRENQIEHYSSILKSHESIADSSCIKALGEKKAAELKASILEQDDVCR